MSERDMSACQMSNHRSAWRLEFCDLTPGWNSRRLPEPVAFPRIHPESPRSNFWVLLMQLTHLDLINCDLRLMIGEREVCARLTHAHLSQEELKFTLDVARMRSTQGCAKSGR